MDLLMVHPEVGVIVVEVKAWSGRYIQRVLGGWFSLLGDPSPRNPLEQAKRAMFNLQKALNGKRPTRLPLCLAMVAMAEENSESPHAGEVPEGHFLFADDLANPDRLRAKVLARSREQAASAHLERPLEPEHLPLMRELLGEISLEQAWIEPQGLKAKLDAWEMSDRCLSEEQRRLATLPIKGHTRLIRGVAGSGKTWVLSEMAARHLVRLRQAHQNGLFPSERPPRVGVVCFNRGLVAHLRGQLERAYYTQTFQSLPENLTVTHFESLRSKENEGYLPTVSKLPIPERSTYQLRTLEEGLRETPETYRLPPFDALFVDEAQDLEPDDIRLLMRLIVPDPHSGEVSLILFYDDAQNLYGKPRPVWKELGLDMARGDRSQVMTCCHRNPREIVELAFNVLMSSDSKQGVSEAKAFVDLQDLKARQLVQEEAGCFRVEFAPRHGDPPILQRFETWNAELEALKIRLHGLLEEGLRPEQILVLAPVFQAEKIATALEASHFPPVKSLSPDPFARRPAAGRDFRRMSGCAG
jgi:hypothetical protein